VNSGAQSGRPLIVITHKVHDEVKDLLSRRCQVIANNSIESWPRERVLEFTRDADALLAFMPDWVDQEFLEQCPRLKIVAAALKGYDNFDIEACTRRGVWFTVVPDLLSAPTAELAMGLILGITRNIPAGDRLVRSGVFQGWRPVLYGTGLHGRTVGIVGMGKLGRSLAQFLTGFGVTMIYADPKRLGPEEERALGAMQTNLDHLLSISDIVVLLLPLTQSSLHLINAGSLRQMKSGSFLVNVGRGSVVDEEAVADALAAGHLAGYAADVFEMEDWARPDHPRKIPERLLADCDHTLFTPHLGSAVKHVRLEIEMAAARNILEALAGRRPSGALNEPVASKILQSRG
jgi:phosphonate dehydrogenase